MARRPVIGLMGGGDDARRSDVRLAEQLGRRVAERGWVLLTGGRASGVMAAANRGAKSVSGSLTIGILPSVESETSAHVDVAIFTNLGDARNAINVISSDVVVICGRPGAGTASEAALALKARRPVVFVDAPPETVAFFRSVARGKQAAAKLRFADDVADCIDFVEALLRTRKRRR